MSECNNNCASCNADCDKYTDTGTDGYEYTDAGADRDKHANAGADHQQVKDVVETVEAVQHLEGAVEIAHGVVLGDVGGPHPERSS